MQTFLRKEQVKFVLIWQFYDHGGKLNCLCFSNNPVSVNWLMWVLKKKIQMNGSLQTDAI